MEPIYEIGRFFSANLAPILTFAGGIVAAYFAFRTKASGDTVEAAKVAVSLREVHTKERALDADDRQKMEARFDAFMVRLEREREEARREREESRRENLALQRTIGEQTGHISALTERVVENKATISKLEQTIEALKTRVGQLVAYIEGKGDTVPPPREAKDI